MKKNGFRPDVVSYTSLLNAYRRSEQPKKAREVFHLKKQNNCEPNVDSYNTLIDAYGSNGFLAKAIDVLRDMEQNGVHPNIVSICTLLVACGRVGQRVKIDSILSAAELRGIALNTIAYNAAIGSYMNFGDHEKAIELYRSMRKKKVKPDCGRFTEAESTFTKMKVAGCSPDLVTYTTMIHACTSVGDWEKAAALFKEMRMNNVHQMPLLFRLCCELSILGANQPNQDTCCMIEFFGQLK
ncbi:hypothetical protein RHSIM_Rhsim03G0026600 [Rhododendron simsii]|uniref:Pentatricopeptide repeat-containing protein n=1 Tax=Rhododendron simsii TaxID=118357 RepID=A0A834H617_RHOSS|nr:hypothetical protein RHSIM_Rhsim03G0026600 [Rhododendron simsii]